MIDRLTLLFGTSYTGKTARMLHELRSERRVVLCDPKCAQLADLKGWSHLWPKYDEKLKLWADDTVSTALRNVRHDDFRIIIHTRWNHPAQLDFLCRQLMAVKDCVLAIDECALYCPSGSLASLPQHVMSVAVSGTHEGIRVIGTAQKISLVHFVIRSNAKRMLFYRMFEKADLDRVRDYLPPNWDTSPQFLPDYTCIDWRDGREPFIDSSLVGKLKTLPGKRVGERAAHV